MAAAQALDTMMRSFVSPNSVGVFDPPIGVGEM